MKLPLSDFIIDFDVLTAVNDNVLVYIASTTHIKYCTMERTNRGKKTPTSEQTNIRKRLNGTHRDKKKQHTEKTQLTRFTAHIRLTC